MSSSFDFSKRNKTNISNELLFMKGNLLSFGMKWMPTCQTLHHVISSQQLQYQNFHRNEFSALAAGHWWYIQNKLDYLSSSLHLEDMVMMTTSFDAHQSFCNIAEWSEPRGLSWSVPAPAVGCCITLHGHERSQCNVAGLT